MTYRIRVFVFAGLPSANKQHASDMAKFAAECLRHFKEETRKLEVVLGPDTGELGLRIGINSGPVTAGVLRGDRSRFQLFGGKWQDLCGKVRATVWYLTYRLATDTVNTAARMESSGMRDRIQVSESTARLLQDAGEGEWLTPRSDPVVVKGKGTLSLYWLDVPSAPSQAMSSNTIFEKHRRLVGWMSEMFTQHTAKVIARQDPTVAGRAKPEDLVYHLPSGTTSLDEVASVIVLPQFCAQAAARGSRDVEVPANVRDQIHDVVERIAAMYQDNPFHNFEHACHVTQQVAKFIGRIATPDIDEDAKNMASQLHEYTHGITSDPITIWAIVFSALIHDVDHRGVSNTQLATEEAHMAAVYRNQSIAEQNSLDLAWGVLMEDRYQDLRAALFVDRHELMRFRQIVVQVVLATDIFDKELNNLRKERWARAFNGDSDSIRNNDLRATIVIEHVSIIRWRSGPISVIF